MLKQVQHDRVNISQAVAMLLDAEHGDDDWIKNIYLSWHPFSILEYAGFLISIILLYFYVK